MIRTMCSHLARILQYHAFNLSYPLNRSTWNYDSYICLSYKSLQDAKLRTYSRMLAIIRVTNQAKQEVNSKSQMLSLKPFRFCLCLTFPNASSCALLFGPAFSILVQTEMGLRGKELPPCKLASHLSPELFNHWRFPLHLLHQLPALFREWGDGSRRRAF